MTIPQELLARIDEAITHYPVSKRSASLPLLHLWQEHFGFISDEAISWIAEKLELQPINILELVTFYPMFRQKPAGKKHIRICRTLSCAMAGSYQLKDAIAAAVAFARRAGISVCTSRRMGTLRTAAMWRKRPIHSLRCTMPATATRFP
jgi:NADH:ubiquinone oxidoreductase subunit E